MNLLQYQYTQKRETFQNLVMEIFIKEISRRDIEYEIKNASMVMNTFLSIVLFVNVITEV